MEEANNSYSSAESLAKVNGGVIAKLEHPLSIGELECALLEKYPRDAAEKWDRTGLIVGDPAALVSRILIALDPTLAVIDTAQQAEATLVLTHHPVFLDAPTEFLPLSSSSQLAGTIVARALSQGIALMNFHTALDSSFEAQRMLPSLLNLKINGCLHPLPAQAGKGYGAICCSQTGEAFRLDHLAARCVSVFGSMPRVWGSPSATVSTIAVVNGSAGSVVDDCFMHHADCLICGEIHYHQALDAIQKGLTLIEVGHDVSEIPLTALLAQAVMQIGVSPQNVLVYDQAPYWFVPDATRA